MQNLKISDIKPLACINCGCFQTDWIPVHKNGIIVETILVCEKCSHNERLKQPAFKKLFRAWLEMKLRSSEFQIGLSNILKNKN